MAQSDLEISGARRLLVEGRLTDKLKRRLRSEVADPAKRRKCDESNALLLFDFDKIISEEAKTSSKLLQVTGFPLLLLAVRAILFHCRPQGGQV